MSPISSFVARAVQLARQCCFPPRCSFCDRLQPPLWCDDAARCCTACAAATAWLPHPVPMVAAARAPLWAHALCRYDGPVVDAIHRLKFGGRRDIARGLAALLAAQLASPSYDAIVPVPLSALRLRRRGYNQAALVAHDVAAARALLHGRRVGEPVGDWLVRLRDTAPQVGQSAAARRANLRGAFALAAPAAAVAGRRVLLLDDVLTTGTTLRTCARVLERAGADVHIAAIAVA